MSTTLTDLRVTEQPIVTCGAAWYEYTEELEEQFTVSTRFEEDVKLYEIDEGFIRLPRAVCPIGVLDERTRGLPIKIESKVVPKSAEQARIIKEAYASLVDGASLTVQAATGVGKTVIACDLIGKLKRKTLVIVTKDDLLEQWVKELAKFTTLKKEEIGVIKQDRCEVAGTMVVVALVHSLCIPDRYPELDPEEFGLVIWDECHRMGADTFSRTAFLFPARLRLGLSATPDRVDGKEIVFQAHIGTRRVVSMKADLTPKVFYWESAWKVPIVHWYGKTQPLPHEAGKLGGVLNSLVENEDRNHRAVSLLLLCHKRKRRAVGFSDRVEHLKYLKSRLIDGGVPESDIVLYCGTMSKKAKEAALTAKMILATYQKMGEGTDIPALDACILLTPRAHVAQVVGRILRIYPEKKQPVVFDLVDMASEVLAMYRRSRFKWYHSIGAEVVKIS